MSNKNNAHHLLRELKRKRTIAGFLNYGIVAFGDKKKDYFIRITDQPIIEHRYVSLRYIALIDLFVILGVILWAVNFPNGWLIFAISFAVACVVFIDQKEIERRARMMQYIIKVPVKIITKNKLLRKKVDKKRVIASR